MYQWLKKPLHHNCVATIPVPCKIRKFKITAKRSLSMFFTLHSPRPSLWVWDILERLIVTKGMGTDPLTIRLGSLGAFQWVIHPKAPILFLARASLSSCRKWIWSLLTLKYGLILAFNCYFGEVKTNRTIPYGVTDTQTLRLAMAFVFSHACNLLGSISKLDHRSFFWGGEWIFFSGWGKNHIKVPEIKTVHSHHHQN